MRLALAEIRRAKLRFGLLTGAVALLVFLILFPQGIAGLVGRTGGWLQRRLDGRRAERQRAGGA